MPRRAANDILVDAEGAYKGVLTDPAAFVATAASLVEEAARARAPEAHVVALRARAWAEHELLDNELAKRGLDLAARIARRNGLTARLAEVLVSRAAVSQELGRFAAAARDLDVAAALAPPSGRPDVLLQKGTLLLNLGRLNDAARAYESVVGDPHAAVMVRAKVANNLAYIAAELGRAEAALRYVEVAVELAAGLGSTMEAYFASTRAWVHVRAGRLTEGFALFDEARTLYLKAGLNLGDHLDELADLFADLRLLPEAIAASTAAAAEFDKHRASLMAAESHLRLARLTLLSGDPAGARLAATRATALFRKQRRSVWAARAAVVAQEAARRDGDVSPSALATVRRCATTLERHGMLATAIDAQLTAGRMAVAVDRPDLALDSFGRAERLSRGSPVLTRLKGRIAAATAAEVQGDPVAVVRQSRLGLRDLDRHRAALPSMELRALASGHGAELGDLGLRALVPMRSAERIFAWMERTRAAALVAVDPPMGADVQRELAALRALHAELARADASSEAERTAVAGRIAAVETRVRRATWTADHTADAERLIVTPAQLRRLLDGAVLVEYAVLDGAVLAAVVGARRTTVTSLGPIAAVERDVDALLFALRRLTRAVQGHRTSAAAARAAAERGIDALRQRLLAPLEIPPDIPLVVVPVGELQRVPWSALHSAVTSAAPSAAFWARTRRQPLPSVGQRVALVAGPGLEAAVDEVAAVRAAHRDAIVLAPPESTVAAATAALDGATVAHLACHGRLRADNPTFSSLQLSDGALTVHELGMHGRAPHRVVLAACESGAEGRYAGNETLGFVSALLARGTAGVVASSVLVPDVDAVRLMAALHRHVVSGSTLAEALHAARDEVGCDDPGAYVNWCAFTAYGAA